jgi:hypothetical protein
MVEAGQSIIDDGSKSQFLEGLRLLQESFSIFSSFCLWMQANSVVID